MLYRNNYYASQKLQDLNDHNSQLIELNVAKQRNGPIGTIKLSFDEQRTKFFNLEI